MVLTVGTDAAVGKMTVALELVVRAAEGADYVIVEGQGALTHPGFSGVTLGLLHGSAPDVMVLVHDATRRAVKGFEDLPLRPLREYVPMYEEAVAWGRPAVAQRARVVAVALNTYGRDEASADAAIETAARQTGLPATDAVRYGADVIAEAVVAR